MDKMQPGAEVEIELAYLPKWLPEELSTVTPTRIADVYISSEADLLTKLRLRQNGQRFELTKKVVLDPSDLSVQQEYNTPLTAEEFEKLRAVDGREVIKDRYVFDIDGHRAEMDIFLGRLAGFCLVEFEFNSVEAKEKFVPPVFCGPEVTQEDFIAGAYLAGKSYQDVENDLVRLDYTALHHETQS